MTRKVLFACTYNATRSPMAQALCGLLAAKGAIGAVEAASAGVYTGAAVDPMAIEAMAELGADITEHAPHSFADIELNGGDLGAFDVVIALSPAAHRRAVDYLRDTDTPIELWGVADATAVEGPETARREAYRAARDALAERIQERFSAGDRG
ncbi:MAG: low molecular weight phosphatase family protein [Pseudomonadota bacterium]